MGVVELAKPTSVPFLVGLAIDAGGYHRPCPFIASYNSSEEIFRRVYCLEAGPLSITWTVLSLRKLSSVGASDRFDWLCLWFSIWCGLGAL